MQKGISCLRCFKSVTANSYFREKLFDEFSKIVRFQHFDIVRKNSVKVLRNSIQFASNE